LSGCRATAFSIEKRPHGYRRKCQAGYSISWKTPVAGIT
jgi:hypothetical protein